MKRLALLFALLAAPLAGQVPQNPAGSVPVAFSSGVVFSSATTGANVTLLSTQYPANALYTPSSTAFYTAVWIRAYGRFANNVNAKIVRLAFGGTVIDSSIATVSAANVWAMDCMIHYRASGSETFFCNSQQGTTTPTTVQVGGALSLDATSALSIVVSINNQVAGSDVFLDGIWVVPVQ